MTDESNKLNKLVKRRHPDYADNVEHWAFLDSCYKGGRTWIRSNIHRYFKEGNTEHEARIERAYRFNHTKEVVDLVDKYLFRAKIVRQKDAPDYLLKFWKDPTGNGKDMDSFSKQMSRRTSVLGRNWIVIDNNASEVDGKLTKAAVKAKDVKVYAYLVGPEDVLDMSYDKFNRLNWILIRETSRDDSNPLIDSFSTVNQYRLWTKNAWLLLEEVADSEDPSKTKVIERGSGEHKLGMVPVVSVDHIVNDQKWSSPAMISDIGYLDKAVANYLSNLDAIIQDQTFSQLAMPAQGLLPGDLDHDKVLKAGTKRIFTFDGEAGGAPFYLNPDVKQAQIIMDVVVRIIGEIYHSIGMAGERTKQDNAIGIDNSSGVAKAYDFERINAMLAAKANALDMAEREISRVVAKWHGEDIEGEDYIKYPEDFDTRGVFDELEMANSLLLIDAPVELRRAQMEMLVNKIFPRMAKEDKKKIIDDVKGWPENSFNMNEVRKSEESLANRESIGNKRDNSQGQVVDKKTPAKKVKADNSKGQVQNQNDRD